MGGKRLHANPQKSIDVAPEVIRQIYDDRFRSAADYDPLERDIVRRIDLLVRQPQLYAARR